MIVVTPEEMRKMDLLTIKQNNIKANDLMENAGRMIYKHVSKFIQEVDSKKIVVFCGVGNNGGDGLVLSRLLIKNGHEVKIFICGNIDKMSPETKNNFLGLKKINADIEYISTVNDTIKIAQIISASKLLIDALLGIGLNKPIRGYLYNIIEMINKSTVPIISIDIPTGIRGDNGKISNIAIKANKTIIIQTPKTGNILNDSVDHQGNTEIVDICIPMNIIKTNINLISNEKIKELFPTRKQNTHKYSFGHVLVIGGSIGMIGAPVMTSLSAMRTGSGLVTLGVNNDIYPMVCNQLLEVMVRPIIDFSSFKKLIERKTVIAFGPGLGRDNDYSKALELLLNSGLPIVIDADGIYHLNENKSLLEHKKSPIVITPHPGEMSRFCDVSKEEILDNPIYWSKMISQKYDINVVLKGHHTIICNSQGKIFINTTGNAGMATAGSGDVLTGIIASLIGQNLKVFDASVLGVYLHGKAGDIAKNKYGEMSLIATDIINNISIALNFINSNVEG